MMQHFHFAISNIIKNAQCNKENDEVYEIQCSPFHEAQLETILNIMHKPQISSPLEIMTDWIDFDIYPREISISANLIEIWIRWNNYVYKVQNNIEFQILEKSTYDFFLNDFFHQFLSIIGFQYGFLDARHLVKAECLEWFTQKPSDEFYSILNKHSISCNNNKEVLEHIIQKKLDLYNIKKILLLSADFIRQHWGIQVCEWIWQNHQSIYFANTIFYIPWIKERSRRSFSIYNVQETQSHLWYCDVVPEDIPQLLELQQTSTTFMIAYFSDTNIMNEMNERNSNKSDFYIACSRVICNSMSFPISNKCWVCEAIEIHHYNKLESIMELTQEQVNDIMEHSNTPWEQTQVDCLFTGVTALQGPPSALCMDRSQYNDNLILHNKLQSQSRLTKAERETHDKIRRHHIYKGDIFSSQCEARFAVFLSNLGIIYTYEPDRIQLEKAITISGRYNTNSQQVIELIKVIQERTKVAHLSTAIYIPDFYLPNLNMYIEIKPAKPDLTEYSRLYLCHIVKGCRVVIAYGDIIDLPYRCDRTYNFKTSQDYNRILRFEEYFSDINAWADVIVVDNDDGINFERPSFHDMLLNDRFWKSSRIIEAYVVARHCFSRINQVVDNTGIIKSPKAIDSIVSKKRKSPVSKIKPIRMVESDRHMIQTILTTLGFLNNGFLVYHLISMNQITNDIKLLNDVCNEASSLININSILQKVDLYIETSFDEKNVRLVASDKQFREYFEK